MARKTPSDAEYKAATDRINGKNQAETAVLTNHGLLGNAGRALRGRADRVEEIINSSTTPDYVKPPRK